MCVGGNIGNIKVHEESGAARVAFGLEMSDTCLLISWSLIAHNLSYPSTQYSFFSSAFVLLSLVKKDD